MNALFHPLKAGHLPGRNEIRRAIFQISLGSRALLAAIALSGIVLSKVGAATADEGFSYPDGSAVAGQSGGTGWAAAWESLLGNGTIVTETGSLTYPGIASTGARMHFTGIPATGTSTRTFRNLSTALAEGTTHYIRILAQNLNEGRRFFGLALFNGNTENMLLGQTSTFGNWTINHVADFSGTMGVMDSGVDSSSVALLVLKLELLPGTERVTFWVNPDLSQAESVATAVNGASFLTDNDFVQVTRVRIGGGGFSETAGGDPTDHYLDEISISTASPFADPYTTWINGFGIGTAALRMADADPDNDSLVNAQEFYFNTSPVSHNSIQPTLAGTNVRIAFQRRDDAEALNVALESSTTLATGSWVAAQHGVNGVLINISENGAAPDDVEVLIPRGVDLRKFARFRLTFD